MLHKERNVKRSFDVVLTSILYVDVTHIVDQEEQGKRRKNILFNVLVSCRSYDQFLE